MRRIFLGIDPGQRGALASIDLWDDGRRKVDLFDTPLLTVKNGNKIKHEYNEAAMTAMLFNFLQIDVRLHCVLEKVNAMPGQGVTSMFNFGMGYGMWRGMLSAFQIPYTLVHPATWKKEVMHDMGKEKQASIQRVMQLYPQLANRFERKKDDGRADALLLAHYGMLHKEQG